MASAEAFGGGSTEARGEGASGESENRPRPAAFSWVRSLRNLSRHFLDFACGTPSHGIRQIQTARTKLPNKDIFLFRKTYSSS